MDRDLRHPSMAVRQCFEQAGRLAAYLLLAAALSGCATVVSVPDYGAPTPAMLAAVQRLAPHRCNATTASVLDALEVQPDDIQSLSYNRRISGPDNETLKSHDGWISLRGQTGDLVIRHSPSCRFMTGYTQGDLTLPSGSSP